MTLFEESTQNLRHGRDFQELVSVYLTGQTQESSEKKSLRELFIGCLSQTWSYLTLTLKSNPNQESRFFKIRPLQKKKKLVSRDKNGNVFFPLRNSPIATTDKQLSQTFLFGTLLCLTSTINQYKLLEISTVSQILRRLFK